MNGLTRRALLLGGLGAGTSMLGSCCSLRRGEQQTPPIVIASGSMSGVYYTYAQAWSRVERGDLDLKVLSTSGSVENTHMLATGQAGVAFSAIDAAAEAAADPSTRICALGRLYDDYIHLVVLGTSRIESIAQLRGKRVCVGAPGSGTTLISDRLLTVSGLAPTHDISRSQMNLDDSMTALRNGIVDAVFWSGGLPTSAITDLATSLLKGHTAASAPEPIRLIDLADATRLLRRSYGTSYRIGVIPGHTYPGISAPVSTLAVPNVLLTNTNRSTASARTLIERLFDDATQIGRTVPPATNLNRHIAIFTEPVPLHPGAIAYYRSVAVDV